jgi:hypothetical protein
MNIAYGVECRLRENFPGGPWSWHLSAMFMSRDSAERDKASMEARASVYEYRIVEYLPKEHQNDNG